MRTKSLATLWHFEKVLLDDPIWLALMECKRWDTPEHARAAWQAARRVHGVKE